MPLERLLNNKFKLTVSIRKHEERLYKSTFATHPVGKYSTYIQTNLKFDHEGFSEIVYFIIDNNW